MNLFSKTTWLKGIVGLSLLAVGTGAAHANLTPTLDSVTPVGSDFKWTYSAAVGASQKVITGDYFTIYDFDGYTGAHAEPVGWSLTVQNIGITPAHVMPGDDPTLPNLTWTYTGAAIVGPAPLGLFSANTSMTLMKQDFFAGVGTRITDGTKIANVGEIQVPTHAPEPATMALLGAGAMPLLRTLRRRRQSPRS